MPLAAIVKAIPLKPDHGCDKKGYGGGKSEVRIEHVHVIRTPERLGLIERLSNSIAVVVNGYCVAVVNGWLSDECRKPVIAVNSPYEWSPGVI